MNLDKSFSQLYDSKLMDLMFYGNSKSDSKTNIVLLQFLKSTLDVIFSQ